VSMLCQNHFCLSIYLIAVSVIECSGWHNCMQCHILHVASHTSLIWKTLPCLTACDFPRFFYDFSLPPFSLLKLSFVPFLLPALESLCIPLTCIPPLLIPELFYYCSILALTFAPLLLRPAAFSRLLSAVKATPVPLSQAAAGAWELELGCLYCYFGQGTTPSSKFRCDLLFLFLKSIRILQYGYA